MYEIATDRLLLRLPTLEDAPAIARGVGDFGVAGNLARVPHPYAPEMAATFVRSLPRRPAPEETSFAIVHEHEVIGIVGFSADRPTAEIGYWLARPFWGIGMMSEAVRAALFWYFQTSGADRVLSGAFSFNAPSLAVQAKMGFVETGRSTRQCLARNAVLAHIDTELRKDAFIKAVAGRT